MEGEKESERGRAREGERQRCMYGKVWEKKKKKMEKETGRAWRGLVKQF